MAYRDSTYVSGAFDFYLFAKNIQGDILYIYNTSGTRLVTYTYDAWGKVLRNIPERWRVNRCTV